jgi:RNA polymerase sigma factor (sigma-70 family)
MSTSEEGLAGAAGVVQMTENERERLLRVYEPVEYDLLRIAAVKLRFVPSHEPEDAVQEAFLSFARWALRGRLKCLGCRRLAEIDDAELGQYLPRCHSFLKSLVSHQCLNFMREAIYRPRISLGWHGDRQGCDAHPDGELLRQEQSTRVRRAVARLPAQLHEVVVLRFYWRHTIEEIATILRIPSGTVKSRIHRLKRELRSLLSAEAVENA